MKKLIADNHCKHMLFISQKAHTKNCSLERWLILWAAEQSFPFNCHNVSCDELQPRMTYKNLRKEEIISQCFCFNVQVKSFYV